MLLRSLGNLLVVWQDLLGSISLVTHAGQQIIYPWPCYAAVPVVTCFSSLQSAART